MRCRARNNVIPREGGSARFGRDFWLRHKEMRIAYLNRPNIVMRDNHARAAFREMPESNGKVICQADAAV